MIESKELTDTWHDWIRTNLERGCTTDAMLQAMVKAQVDPL